MNNFIEVSLLLARYGLWIISLEYVFLGVCLILANQKGLGWSYIFYACANVGIYFATLGM